nr:SRPBCC family protein [Methylomarinum sp. Ch1-1]MDP4520337.1 SRPBCC family protein [Methylomarinum sp. Ch1-1]
MGSASIEIDKPVRQVFSFVAEHFFDNYPKWALEVVEFKPINNNPLKVGALARQARIDQGHKVESTFEISRYETDSLLELNGLSEPFRHSYHFASQGEDKTLLTDRFELLELELFMRPFEKLISRAIEEGLQNSIHNIKKLLS